MKQLLVLVTKKIDLSNVSFSAIVGYPPLQTVVDGHGVVVFVITVDQFKKEFQKELLGLGNTLFWQEPVHRR